MADIFPPPDYALSPHTGWTRAHWEAVLARLTYGYLRAAVRYALWMAASLKSIPMMIL